MMQAVAVDEITAAKERIEAGQPDVAGEQQQMIVAQLTDMLAEMQRPKVKIPVRDESGLIIGIREEAA